MSDETPAARLYVDLVALALILLGIGGLVTCAFLVNPLLGAAVLSGAALAGGITLGLTN